MATEHQNQINYAKSQTESPKFQRLTINLVCWSLTCALLVSLGCVRQSTTMPQASMKNQTRPNQLIKPVRIPEPQEIQSWSGPANAARYPNRDQGVLQNRRYATAPPVQVRISKPQDEDQQVRTAALELSRSIGPVQKIKLCYVTKDEEWWATFYEDIGPVIDVKQFIWNRDSERFEPFLVLKRIPKSKLTAELKREERDRTCTVIPLTEFRAGSQPPRPPMY